MSAGSPKRRADYDGDDGVAEQGSAKRNRRDSAPLIGTLYVPSKPSKLLANAPPLSTTAPEVPTVMPPWREAIVEVQASTAHVWELPATPTQTAVVPVLPVYQPDLPMASTFNPTIILPPTPPSTPPPAYTTIFDTLQEKASVVAQEQCDAMVSLFNATRAALPPDVAKMVEAHPTLFFLAMSPLPSLVLLFGL
jgi:hypothetical protein